MPKFSFKEKTGVTETQWAQVVAATLSIAGHQLGYTELSINAGLASQVILGVLGAYLRNKDKKKNA